MDQVKEYLRLAVKYRFWIAVGVAALLPVIAYSVTAGSLAEETKKKTDEIQGAYKGVQAYTSGVITNRPYTEAVGEKTKVVEKDVTESWRKLYERQAPLLTWPEEVTETIQKWGRKWPEGVPPRVVNNEVENYLRVYPREVTEVYNQLKPWDPIEGTGIVVAPPEQALLQPAPFDPDKVPLPSLGKIWAAQERLWTQGVLIDVIAKVNEKAKADDWDSAPVKQVNSIVVASPLAQDQRSTAKGDTLEPAPDITDPSKPAEEAPAEGAEGAGAGMPGSMDQSSYLKSMGGMVAMSGMGGMSGGMMGGGGAAEEVYYLKTEGTQYQVVPFMVSLLIDQSRIPDLLVEFQNSPMSIQVLEFEMTRPATRVQKPVKGEAQQFMGYGGMMGMSGMGGRTLGGGMMGYPGGMMGAGMGEGGYPGGGGMMGYPGGMSGAGMGEGGYPGGGGMQGYPSGPGGMAGYPGMGRGRGKASSPQVPIRQGTIVQKNIDRDKNKEKDKDKQQKKDEPAQSKIADPYFNVVELKIYGQARFYVRPPEPEAEPASEAPAAEGEAPAADQPKADEPAKDAAPEAGEPAPKGDEPAAPDAAAKPDDAPKAEPAPGDQPKADRPEADQPKGDEPKGEPAQPEVTDQPKAPSEAPKR